ncbi:MAG: hypothetical protein ACE5IW_12740 [bacterium]
MNKRIIIWLLFCLAISHVCGCAKMFNEQDLYGVWEGKNKQLEMAITFNENSTCKIVYKEDSSEPVTLTGKFEVDFSKTPIPLTIRNIPQLNHPLHTIIQFRELDVIRMAEFAPRWRLRPISFNRDTEITLRRRNIAPKK